MQFLLLLSALLSAVTGAFVGPRAVAEQVSQAEAQVTAPGATSRAESPLPLPAAALSTFVADPAPVEAAPVLLIAAVPLTDVRLNE